MHKDAETSVKALKILALQVQSSDGVANTAIRDAAFQLEEYIERVRQLEAAIITTLEENGHLADGDNCTLIALKRAMPNWE